MKFRIFAVLIALTMCAGAGAQALKPVEVLPGVTIKLPSDFSAMSAETIKRKYPTEPRPKLVYTDASSRINLVVQLTTNAANPELIDAYQKQLAGVFGAQHTLTGGGVMVVNGKKVGFNEFVSKAADTDIYNFMFYTDFDGTLLMFSFNCTIAERPAWEKKARQIMESLSIGK